MSNENDGEKTLVDTQLPASLLAELEEKYQKHQRQQQNDAAKPGAAVTPTAQHPLDTPTPSVQPQLRPLQAQPMSKQAIDASGTAPPLAFMETQPFDDDPDDDTTALAGPLASKPLDSIGRMKLAREDTGVVDARDNMAMLRRAEAAGRENQFDTTLSPAELERAAGSLSARSPGNTGQTAPAPSTPGPVLRPAPMSAPTPAPTPETTTETAASEGQLSDGPEPAPEKSPQELLFSLPELAPIPLEAGAIQATPRSESVMGSLGYAFQQMKARSQITTCTRLLTQRGTALSDKKQDLLADLGRAAYGAGVRTSSTETTEQQLAVTLKDLALKGEQIASVDAIFHEFERAFNERNGAKLEKERHCNAEVERLRTEKSSLQTRVKSLKSDLDAAIRGMESAQKKLEKLNSSEKKPENWQQQVDQLQTAIAENQNKLQNLAPEQQSLDGQLSTVSASLEQSETTLKGLLADLAEEKKGLDAANTKRADDLAELEKETRALNQTARGAQERIGFALWNNTDLAPQFIRHYKALQEVDGQLTEDKKALLAFEQVRSQLRGDYAKKGWMIMAGIAGIVILLVVLLIVVL